jgi:exodeoxyribonuclease VII small subunit
MNPKDNKEEIAFEEALLQLKSIVEQLESGNMTLDDSISQFEKGMVLHDLCKKKLDSAKLKISKIALNNGKLTDS